MDLLFSSPSVFLFPFPFASTYNQVWDSHKSSAPVSVINVNQNLRPHLPDLYETDNIFDKFEASVSGCGNYVATGTYNNIFQVHNREGTLSASTEVSRTVPRKRLALGGGKNVLKNNGKRADGGGETLQFDKKIMYLAWHPERDVVAIAGLNRLYFYTV